MGGGGRLEEIETGHDEKNPKEKKKVIKNALCCMRSGIDVF